ncbi:hypothetical protein BH23PLA1_BH23PLA1_20320 [soil metagenome]
MRFTKFDEEEEFDIEVAINLLTSFGQLRLDPLAHRRAVWLCVLATRRILFGWSGLGCEGQAPHEAIRAAAAWVANGRHPDHFARYCLPAEAIRDGQRVADCDACVVEPIASAAARTAYYTKTASPIDGAIALCDIRGAVLEGLEHPDGVEFNDWLINPGVTEAFRLIGVGEDPIATSLGPVD